MANETNTNTQTARLTRAQQERALAEFELYAALVVTAETPAEASAAADKAINALNRDVLLSR